MRLAVKSAAANGPHDVRRVEPRQEHPQWLFVGAVVPDEAAFRNPAFSPAGQMCQENLLLGMKHAGMPASAVLSVRPIPSFPRARRLWVGGGRAMLPEGIEVTLLPFLNLTPLKQIGIGLSVLWRILLWGWRTRTARRRIVLTYNLSVPPGLFTWLAAKLIGAKAVAMVYDVEVPGQTVPWSIRRWLDLWLHRWVLPRFDGIISISDAIVRDLAPGHHYLRVEGGIRQDVIGQTGADPSQFGDDRAGLTIVFAGSLDEPNGVSLMLDAFSRLPGGYRLRIAGRGPLEDKVRQAAASDSRIDYLGFLPHRQVLALYRSADLLVSARLTKGLNTRYFFPSKLMEYLASGVPVISTCTGHVEEEFGGFVYLLREETAESLAGLIAAIAASPRAERIEMGRRARGYMAAHKTWDSQSARVVTYLRESVLRLHSPRRENWDSPLCGPPASL